MPHLAVPLCRYSNRTAEIKVSYTVHGHGPILVVLVPGLCVPGNMYDSMASLLAATAQFTTVAIDNRGIGDSDVPYSSLLGGPGYTVSELAHDAWDVVDHVFENRGSSASLSNSHTEHVHDSHMPLHPHVALIGHSMGGMIVQAMLAQRPKLVRFAALLATHAGGVWNMLPTIPLIRSAVHLAWNGFDRDVHAAVNLSLHFTKRFLEDSFEIDNSLPLEFSSLTASYPPSNHTVEASQASVFAEDDGLRHRHRSVNVSYPLQQRATASDALSSQPSYQDSLKKGISFVEAKVVEFARDSQVFFGICVSSLPENLRHPKQFLLDTIASKAQWCDNFRRRRRWDIYHARYTGNDEDEPDTNDRSRSGSKLSARTEQEMASSESETSPFTYYGHMAVVRSHYLSKRLARELSQCISLVKLVVIGRHDQIIAPSSSRALASSIDANTVVEVDAAHFVTDEAVAEVTTHVMYGLRKAFCTNTTRKCTCDWCNSHHQEREAKEMSCTPAKPSMCRMC